MSLLDALENFAINLPSALDDLKDLRRDFRRTFDDLALEGAELFTLGFEEMVLKENAGWKTSEENRTEARRLVLGARELHPELARRYERARECLVERWESLEKKRQECWEGLQELDSFLPLEDCRENCGWAMPASLPSTGPDGETILSTLAQEAYRRVMKNHKFTVEPGNAEEPLETLLSRVAQLHRRSEEEVAAAQAHAKDSEAVKALAAWECEQLEPLADLVSRSAKIFRAGSMYCMAKATEIEQLLDGGTDLTLILETHGTTRITARALADLLAQPLTASIQDLPGVNPAFIDRLNAVESVLKS